MCVRWEKIRYWKTQQIKDVAEAVPKRKDLSERTRYLIDGLANSWTESDAFST